MVSDQQQFNFQTRKYSLLKSKKRNELKGDFKRGFLTLGAFRYSRHPNFFAEFSMWFVLYVFTVRVTSVWLNFTLIGPVVLWSLFQGSTWLTESICCGKYPEYRDYQSMTSRLIPWFPGPSTWKEA
jgi:steroid 5-alpha reductase family enzyme